MHPYRTHHCDQLRISDEGSPARLSGWVHSKRDHGNLLFVDLRDENGLTQCVIDVSSKLFETVEAVRVESVLTVTGKIVKRSDDTINPALPTGEVELTMDEVVVESPAEVLPMQVAGSEDFGEETRLRYRFIDLRRDQMQKNIRLRNGVISSIPPAHDRRRLHGIPDSHPDRVIAGRRARLSGAVAPAPGAVLRPAAGAAAISNS